MLDKFKNDNNINYADYMNFKLQVKEIDETNKENRNYLLNLQNGNENELPADAQILVKEIEGYADAIDNKIEELGVLNNQNIESNDYKKPSDLEQDVNKLSSLLEITDNKISEFKKEFVKDEQ